MDAAELARLLEHLIGVGTVAEMRHTTPPTMRLRAGSPRTWPPPTAGEHVVLLCPSDNLSNGVVPRIIPSDNADVPSNGHSQTATPSRDGAQGEA